MAINFLIDYLTGQLAMVMNSTSAGPPPSGGTALFVDTTSINFIGGTNMNWIT